MTNGVVKAHETDSKAKDKGRLCKKRHRAEETTEERAARQQSYMPFSAKCSLQACATVLVSSLCNCSTCLHKVRTYIYIYTVRVIIKFPPNTRCRSYSMPVPVPVERPCLYSSIARLCSSRTPVLVKCRSSTRRCESFGMPTL